MSCCDSCNCEPEPPFLTVMPGANGPSVADEEALLTAEFGQPNEDGVYSAVVEE